MNLKFIKYYILFLGCKMVAILINYFFISLICLWKCLRVIKFNILAKMYHFFHIHIKIQLNLHKKLFFSFYVTTIIEYKKVEN